MDTNDWRLLVEEALADSVPEAEVKLTSHAAVSEWLRDSSYEAAVGTQGVSDRTGMKAYHQLSEKFEEEFSVLFEAVREVTHGCGRVMLDWQPGDPRRTRVRIDFGQEFPVHLYRHFETISDAEVRRFLKRLAAQLPKGAPYPKKPHRVGAVMSYEKVCAALRMTESVTGNERRQQVITLYRRGEPYRRDIPLEDAPHPVTSFMDEAVRG